MRVIFTITCLFILTNLSAELGIATYYSDAFHGSAMASGELYDKNKLTAAHKTLPFGSKVRVTRLDNNKSVVVVVKDRGPYVKGHIVELSKRAAEQLGMLAIEEAKVKLELIERGVPKKKEKKEISIGTIKRNTNEDVAKEEKKTEPTLQKEEFTAKTGEPVTDYSDIEKPKPTKKKKEEKKEPVEAPKKKKKKLTTINRKGFQIHDLYKPVAKKPENLGFGIKIGTYHKFENVLKQVAILQENWFSEVYLIVENYINEPTTYKIILESFDDRASATHYAKDVKKKGIPAYVIDLSNETETIYYFRALRPQKEGYGVQVGVISNENAVLKEILKYEKKWLNNILISVEKAADNKSTYKFILGPFPDMPTAQSYKKHSKKKGLNGFVVNLADLKY